MVRHIWRVAVLVSVITGVLAEHVSTLHYTLKVPMDQRDCTCTNDTDYTDFLGRVIADTLQGNGTNVTTTVASVGMCTNETYQNANDSPCANKKQCTSQIYIVTAVFTSVVGSGSLCNASRTLFNTFPNRTTYNNLQNGKHLPNWPTSLLTVNAVSIICTGADCKRDTSCYCRPLNSGNTSHFIKCNGSGRVPTQSRDFTCPYTETWQSSRPHVMTTSGTMRSPVTTRGRTMTSPVTTTGRTMTSPVTTTGRTMTSPVTTTGRTMPSPVTTTGRTMTSPVTTTGRTMTSPVTTTGRTMPSPVTTTGRTMTSPVTTTGRTMTSPITTTDRTMTSPVTTTGRTMTSPVTTTGRTMTSPITTTGRTMASPVTTTGRTMTSPVTTTGRTMTSPVTTAGRTMTSPVTTAGRTMTSPITTTDRTMTSSVTTTGRTMTPPVTSTDRTMTPPVTTTGRTMTPPVTTTGRIMTSPVTTTGRTKTLGAWSGRTMTSFGTVTSKTKKTPSTGDQTTLTPSSSLNQRDSADVVYGSSMATVAGAVVGFLLALLIVGVIAAAIRHQVRKRNRVGYYANLIGPAGLYMDYKTPMETAAKPKFAFR